MKDRGSVFEFVTQGQYRQGLDAYGNITESSAQDARWAGVCALNLQQLEPAKNLLLLAVGEGCAAAAVELATVYRQMGDTQQADCMLATLDESTLDAFDQCLLNRERAALAYTRGALPRASELLETALLRAYQSGRLKEVLIPGVAQLLGLVYGARGLDARAEQNFTLALEHAHIARTVYVHNSRAVCRLHLGRLDGAEEDLKEALQDSNAIPVARPVIHYNLGLLAKAKGDVAVAKTRFEQAAIMAREVQESETECYAELALSMLAACAGDQPAARKHLARGRTLIGNPKADAALLLAEGIQRVHAEDARAVELLERAAEILGALGLRRDAGIAHLYLAEACLVLSNEARVPAILEHVTDYRNALENGAPFAAELRYLPRVLASLQHALPAAYERRLYDDYLAFTSERPRCLEVLTLGSQEVRLDGRPVSFDLTRTVEILVYLLERSDTQLNRVLLDLFPDAPPRLARNYFHQVRYELQRRLPHLRVPYASATKSYRVVTDGYRVARDDRALIEALEQGLPGLYRAFNIYRGEFLPDSESEWAATRREELRHALIGAALRTLQQQPEAEHDVEHALRLARQAQQLDPLDPQINEAVVRLTGAAEGRLSALHVLAQTMQRYEEELCIPPPNLLSLHSLLLGQASRSLDP